MGYFLGLISLLMLSFSISQIFRKSFSITFPISVLLIIFLMYCFGLFTILDIGAYVIAGSIFALFIFSVIMMIRKKSYVDVKKFFSAGFWILLVFSLVQYVFLYDDMISVWDEFSHWATIVKSMFVHGNFGNINTSVLFPGYPPATGIFHSYFLFLGGKFVESTLYMSMNILNFSLILPIFDKLKSKFCFSNVLIVILALFIPTIFEVIYFSGLLVDIYLGVLLAYIIYSYYSNPELNWFNICHLALTLFVMCISKASGLGLALIAAFVILMDIIVFRRDQAKLFLKNKINILYCILPIASIIIAKLSWSIYINFFNLNEAWNTDGVTLSGLFGLLINPTYFQKTVLINFNERIFSNVSLGMFNLSTFSIIILLLLILILTAMFNEKIRKKVYLCAGCLFVGFIVYSLTLEILYLFTYSEYEAMKLASYKRYFATYLVALILIVFYYMVNLYHFYTQNREDENLKTKRNIHTVVSLILAFITFTLIPFGTVINNIQFRERVYESEYSYRYDLNDFKTFVATLDSEKDKVFYVYANSTGLPYYMAIFEALPVEINIPSKSGEYIWSLGKPRYEGDIWSYDITSEEWKNILINDQYTYIYLHNVDKIFVDTYKDLFESEESIINYGKYKVINQNGNITLEKLN